MSPSSIFDNSTKSRNSSVTETQGNSSVTEEQWDEKDDKLEGELQRELAYLDIMVGARLWVTVVW
jgi:hypothetical protein